MRSPLRLRFVPAVAALVLCFSGCALTQDNGQERLRRGEHAIRVNATATSPVVPGTPFMLAAARDRGSEATLLYAEAARMVKAALMAKGMYEAPSRTKAAVLVEIEYAMETPNVSRTNVRAVERGPLEKRLVLTAREMRPGAPPRTLWSVELSTIDTSNDLRKYLPLLAAAAIDEIGVASDGAKTIKIRETDKTVALVRQAAP